MRLARRVQALEKRRAIKNPVVIFSYGDGGVDMTGYYTISGDTVHRQEGEELEAFTERAIKAEARQHPERAEIVLHECYSRDYWQQPENDCWYDDFTKEVAEHEY